MVCSFNTIPFSGHRDPSFGELCWQAFTSLTMGAKGLLYFTYWPGPGPAAGDSPVYDRGNAIIARRALPGQFNESDKSQGPYGPREAYVKGPHWFDAKRINSIVLAYSKLLLHARSTEIFHIGAVDPAAVPAAGDLSATTSTVLRAVDGAVDISGRGGHFLVGQFRLADGRDAVLLHNQDPSATQWATVRFAPRLNVPRNASGVLEVDPVHATLAPLLDDSPLEPGVQLGLRPGMARLLVTTVRL